MDQTTNPHVSTPATSSAASPDKPAHALNAWAEGYAPRSERAAAVWETHRDALEPRISAAPAAGVTEARRVASAVLELIAWAEPLHNDLEQSLSEDSLQRFLHANPNNVSDGALANIRGRVRRVLKASDTPVATEAPAPGDSAPSDTSTPVFSEEESARVQAAEADDADLRSALARPDDVSPAQWGRAREAAAEVDVSLTKARAQRTRARDALNHPMHDSLGRVLRRLSVTPSTLSEVATLLPPAGEADYRKWLRTDGLPFTTSPTQTTTEVDCNPATDEHGGELHDAEPAPGIRARHTPGGSPTVSPNPQRSLPRDDARATTTTTARPPQRKRRVSARQMRLAVAAAKAERQARADSFPESMRTFIREEYSPLEPVRRHWDRLKDAVEATLAASTVRGDDSMRKHVTHLAYYFHWAQSVGLPLLPSTLTRANVARYESEELVNAGKTTRQTRRSRLMAMADQIHPDEAPVKGPPMPHRSIAPPYSPAEIAVIRRVARVQPTAALIRQMCLLVGLGAGAGIDSADLKRLRGKDVIDHGPDEGIEIRVANLRRNRDNTTTRRDRTVWVLRNYEELVRIGTIGVEPAELLLGREDERANVASAVFSRAALSKEVPDLNQGRLRSTWLATHLQRPTPLHVLMQAAGLTTARTLVELLDHLPPNPTAVSSLR